jgi:pectate lyase
MRRIIILLAVAALMTAMTIASAAPALAAQKCKNTNDGGAQCSGGFGFGGGFGGGGGHQTFASPNDVPNSPVTNSGGNSFSGGGRCDPSGCTPRGPK